MSVLDPKMVQQMAQAADAQNFGRAMYSLEQGKLGAMQCQVAVAAASKILDMAGATDERGAPVYPPDVLHAAKDYLVRALAAFDFLKPQVQESTPIAPTEEGLVQAPLA